MTAAEGAQGGRPQLGQTVPPQGVPAGAQVPVAAGGHRGNAGDEGRLALPPVVNAVESTAPAAFSNLDDAGRPAPAPVGSSPELPAPAPQPTGRRRRALAAAQERAAAAEAGPRVPFAL
ncbi:hypothetical protein, partial [Streptomyces sp. SID2563]|uniref:hypothetical protein n=1 Tax=Streptomyces sp. SID2563 TaxID=2690255 RepID=UPI001F17FCC0